MKNKTIELTVTGTYRDGGSLALTDRNGNKYWQNFKYGDNPNRGKIYEGNINDDYPKLAKGNFEISRRRTTVEYVKELVEQL